MYLKKLRKGVAMVELIFAIVIMSIVISSAPMLMSQASSSSLLLAQQEAITAVSSNIGLILTRYWDEQDTNLSLSSPILVTDGNTGFNEVNNTGRRAGTPAFSTRSFNTIIGQFNASTTLSHESNDEDDVDDYNGKLTTLQVGSITSTKDGDYMDDSLEMTTTVVYLQDSPSSGGVSSSTFELDKPFSTFASTGTTSNIKMISVNIKSRDNNATLGTNVTLKAFSCNIGSYSLSRRTFPGSTIP